MNQWTHSFLPGWWDLYLETGEAATRSICGVPRGIPGKIFRHYRDTMHDLGFLYSLFAVGLYKLTGDEEAREMAVRAADELGKRFHFRAGMIQAWGQMDQQYKPGMMICDCMMNLPSLFWAYEETKHPFYLSMAMAHADTSMRYLVREDYSVCHAYQFDVRTGAPKGSETTAAMLWALPGPGGRPGCSMALPLRIPIPGRRPTGRRPLALRSLYGAQTGGGWRPGV